MRIKERSENKRDKISELEKRKEEKKVERKWEMCVSVRNREL